MEMPPVYLLPPHLNNGSKAQWVSLDVYETLIVIETIKVMRMVGCEVWV